MAFISRITARDLTEARTVTARSAGHEFEIQLGHLCNNRCVFCSSGQLTEMGLARPIPLGPTLEAIERARAAGARRITFLGGEPTLHKSFLAALKRAAEVGFDEIVIFTNGVRLADEAFVDSVVALGSFEWRISIQGGNEQAHVAVTGRPDSFRRIAAGLELLRARGQRVTANLCVNEHSYRSLPEYPALVARYGIRQLHVDIIRPASIGERTEAYLREIMPRYREMAPYLRRMLEAFEQWDPEFDVNIGNLPFCVLPEFGHRIHHGGQETVTQPCDERALEAPVDKYAWHASQRRHVPACEGCIFRPQCTGIFGDYLALYGSEEFQAVSLEALRRLDPEQRNFVLLVEPALAPLLRAIEASDVPAGWRCAEVARDGFRRRVEIRFVGAGGSACLCFVPLSTRDGLRRLWVTDVYRAGLSVDPGVPAGALRGLLTWALARLREAPGVTFTEPKSTSPSLSEGLARGRRRVRRLLGEVQRSARIRPWRVVGCRDRDDGAGAVVELRHPTGACIEMWFEIAARDGRSQVSLDFRLGEGTDAAQARPVVQELIRVLGA